MPGAMSGYFSFFARVRCAAQRLYIGPCRIVRKSVFPSAVSRTMPELNWCRLPESFTVKSSDRRAIASLSFPLLVVDLLCPVRRADLVVNLDGHNISQPVLAHERRDNVVQNCHLQLWAVEDHLVVNDGDHAALQEGT